MSEKRTKLSSNITKNEIINNKLPFRLIKNYSRKSLGSKASKGSIKVKNHLECPNKENDAKVIESSYFNLYNNFNFNNCILKVNNNVNNCLEEVKDNNNNNNDKSKIFPRFL